MLKTYSKSHLNTFINTREGETKFGERVHAITNLGDLKSIEAKYVLFGINEDIGVIANNGIKGAKDTWFSVLNKLLNTQHNQFNKGSKVAILGHLEFPDLQIKLEAFNTTTDTNHLELYKMISEIDKEVSNLVFNIVEAGKIPIIIGGGHNNAYGNIKGTSLALNKPIQVINLDAHTDFRALEGRHSGNGFSYAYDEGFLNKYFIFGLHENYTSKNIYRELDALQDDINYNTFEAIEVRKETTFETELHYALSFLKKKRLGIEIDCDAIENIDSSAQTPSGFSVNQVRYFVSAIKKEKKPLYLHICEAHNTSENAKLICYLISDFIK